jgi:hypothetical protein
MKIDMDRGAESGQRRGRGVGEKEKDKYTECLRFWKILGVVLYEEYRYYIDIGSIDIYLHKKYTLLSIGYRKELVV